MAPEQRDGAPVHPAADVYALGVTLRELLGCACDAVPVSLRALADACTAPEAEARPSLDALSAALRAAAR
jgi:serine/threonine protein kinase